MLKLNDLMQKEMTRKEFIATLGFGAATIFGLGGLLQLLGKENPLQQQSTSRLGYGGGVYGGARDHA
jgi:hypothetical protein